MLAYNIINKFNSLSLRLLIIKNLYGTNGLSCLTTFLGTNSLITYSLISVYNRYSCVVQMDCQLFYRMTVSVHTILRISFLLTHLT